MFFWVSNPVRVVKLVTRYWGYGTHHKSRLDDSEKTAREAVVGKEDSPLSVALSMTGAATGR